MLTTSDNVSNTSDDSTQLVRKNKILILGREGSGKLDVLRGLLERTGHADLIEKYSIQPESDNNRQDFCIPWVLDTKYYTAEVGLWIASTVKGDVFDINDWSKIAPAVDAIIFVYNKKEPSSFWDIKQIPSLIQESSPAITLTVAYRSPSDTVIGSDPAHEDWCTEHEFEFVDVDADESLIPTGDQNDFHDREETIGIDRVLEALQSHMWDGLKRKKLPPRFNGNESIVNDSSNISEHPKEEEEVDDDDLNQDMDDLLNSFTRSTDLLPASSELSDMYHHIFGELDTEDGFEKALDKIKIIRDEIKGLPDKERKAMAAKVALSFEMHMGGEDVM